jgi:crossover junction endodeoxyribonuclease RuvC
MRILGIDPGTATTGFGVIDVAGNSYKFVEAGVIRTSPAAAADRLAIIFKEVKHLISEFKPDRLAVELLFFAANVTTAFAVGQSRGVVLLAAAQAGLPIEEFTPLQVKQAVTGYGRADKKQIQAMVTRLLKLNETPKPDDAADGLAIAITAAANREPSRV